MNKEKGAIGYILLWLMGVPAAAVVSDFPAARMYLNLLIY